MQATLPATEATDGFGAQGAGTAGSVREGQKPVGAGREVGESDAMKLVNEAEGALADGDLDAALLMAQQVRRCQPLPTVPATTSITTTATRSSRVTCRGRLPQGLPVVVWWGALSVEGETRGRGMEGVTRQ